MLIRIQHNLLVVKRLSDTRWSAHSDAVSALVKGYKTITSLLDKISGDDNENAKTRSEAQGLAKKMKKLETGMMAELWYRILHGHDKQYAPESNTGHQ